MTNPGTVYIFNGVARTQRAFEEYLNVVASRMHSLDTSVAEVHPRYEYGYDAKGNQMSLRDSIFQTDLRPSTGIPAAPVDRVGQRSNDENSAFSPSGHSLVHDSTSAVSRPVLQGHSRPAANGKDKRRPAASLARHPRQLESPPPLAERVASSPSEEDSK